MGLIAVMAFRIGFHPAQVNAVPDRSADKKAGVVSYENRLRFYLDLKTKRFLQKMALREKLLVDLIQSIQDEVQARGKAGLISGGSMGFQLVDAQIDTLLAQYNEEIRAIKYIVTELDRLELKVQRIDDLKLLSEVEGLKDQLMGVLDEQKLATTRLTKQQAARMIQDYSKEIGQLMQIYDQIDLFQSRAQAMGDVEMVRQLDKEKQRIIKVFEESRIAGAEAEKLVRDYIEEASSMAAILKQMDAMATAAGVDSSLKSNIDEVRERVVAEIDQRILQLFGITQQDSLQGPTLSDYFKTWKSKRIAEYQVAYTRYKIVRENLIKSATESERKRMIEREIAVALLNYSEQSYDLAGMQFQEIDEAYQAYYPNRDGLIFFKGESNFANHYYDAASRDYLEIIQKYPTSQYAGICQLRLMMISYTYGLYDEFFKYFSNVRGSQLIDREEVNGAYYLAGYVHAMQRRYADAKSVLENVKDDSKYYLPAQYLLGIVLTNLEKYTQAKTLFETLTVQKNYPWTDVTFSILKNESLLRLGYLHYQRGEYDRAVNYFDQVSKGYQRYDESLMGQAWANLKRGQYDATINQVDLICNNYLLSNFTYEARVLSAHCKRIQNRPDDALKDLRYVSRAKFMLGQAQEYNQERSHILKQLDELEDLEKTILEHQDRRLYPQVVKIRDLINDALQAFRYRGAVSGRMLSEYNEERRVLIRQIQEFDSIIKYAEENGNKALLADASRQRNRLIGLLERYQLQQSVSGIGYFYDYPVAAKESEVIYRRGILTKLVSELVMEKQRVQQDLELVTQLLAANSGHKKMDAVVDLEIIEDDLQDLNNQLNQFQVWLANHQVIEEVNPETEQWTNLSGFGMSDINFASFRERIHQIGSYSKNLVYLDEVLKGKQRELETRIGRFDSEVRKIEKEMELEKIRLEKLEKEKYFQDLYFETKTQEIETEPEENLDEIDRLFNQERKLEF
ncbi:MAG: hypothetical protein ONB27_06805 [candidate division KSB1 bacterium]|nr:hypothetical protein [candidate division KSB1 bacterium]